MRLGPGLRGHGAVKAARHRRRGPGTPVGATLGAVITILLVAGACGPTSQGPTGTPAATSPGSPSASAGGSPGPKPTAWPTLTIEASIALGAANGDFAKMIGAIATAVDTNDPARIRLAVSDALTFLTNNAKNIPRLQDYPATKPVGDRLAAAYDEMIRGVTQIRDGIDAGDGAAVEAGFATYVQGTKDYAAVTSDLGLIAEQAIFMKRVLLR